MHRTFHNSWHLRQCYTMLGESRNGRPNWHFWYCSICGLLEKETSAWHRHYCDKWWHEFCGMVRSIQTKHLDFQDLHLLNIAAEPNLRADTYCCFSTKFMMWPPPILIHISYLWNASKPFWPQTGSWAQRGCATKQLAWPAAHAFQRGDSFTESTQFGFCNWRRAWPMPTSASWTHLPFQAANLMVLRQDQHANIWIDSSYTVYSRWHYSTSWVALVRTLWYSFGLSGLPL